MVTKKPRSFRIELDADLSVPLRELAYTAVQRAIQEGELLPGSRLSEHWLTRELGMSRTPIREALRKLEADGWLTRTRRGLIVSNLRNSDIADLFGVRRALETYAARVLTEKARPGDIAELRRINRLFSDACSDQLIADAVHLNLTFHTRMTKLAGNQLLTQLTRQLSERMRLLMTYVFAEPLLILSAPDEHERIIDAIECRDAMLADRCLQQHLGRIEQLYQEAALRLGSDGSHTRQNTDLVSKAPALRGGDIVDH